MNIIDFMLLIGLTAVFGAIGVGLIIMELNWEKEKLEKGW